MAAALVAGAFASPALAVTITGGNVGNQIWTAANSPYVVQGDVTVQAGSTLTIQAGTEIHFQGPDMQAAGASTTQVELIVNGTLTVAGTPTAPVIFRSLSGNTGAAGEWYGIELEPGAAAATFTSAVVRNASWALRSRMTASPLMITRSTFRDNNYTAVDVMAGSATLDGYVAENNGNGLNISAAATGVVVTNCLIQGNDVDGISYSTQQSPAVVNVQNCTINGNTRGVDVVDAVQGSAVNVRNSIVTNNSLAGVRRFSTTSPATVTVSYSNVWGNGNNNVNYQNVTLGTGLLSANPQYVNPTAGDFHLQASSVSIDSGIGTGAPDHDLDFRARPVDGDGLADPDGSEFDMGAYEFASTGGAGGAGGTGAGGATGAGGTGGAGGAGGGGGSAGGGAGTGGIGGLGGGSGAGAAGAGGGGAAGTSGRGGGAGSAGAGGAAGAGGTSAGAGGTGTGGTAGTGGRGGTTGGSAGGSAGAGGGGTTGGGGGGAAGTGGGGAAGTVGQGGGGGAAGAGGAAGTGGTSAGGGGGAAGAGGGVGGSVGASAGRGGVGMSGRGGTDAGGGRDGGSDAATPPGSSDGGCGCAVAQRQHPAMAATLLLIAFVIIIRRRRR
jgi:parallel beta helix pectate lyase-like protein